MLLVYLIVALAMLFGLSWYSVRREPVIRFQSQRELYSEWKKSIRP